MCISSVPMAASTAASNDSSRCAADCVIMDL